MSKSEGELFVDHRASPGLPEDVARKMGYEPSLVGEGKLFEAATIQCVHCQQIVIRNPFRERERANCMACGGAYICDMCDDIRREPDYVHLPFKKVVDLVATGKATLVSLGARPLLIPTKGKEI